MRISLFIDLNTIKNIYIEEIQNEALGFGDIISLNAYGAANKISKTKAALSKYSYNIVETPSEYKDRIPMKMITDIYGAATEDSVDILIIATLDAYINPVLSILKKQGKKVYIIGNVDISAQMKNLCNRYIYLEAIKGDSVLKAVNSSEEMANEIKNIISIYKSRGEEIKIFDAYNNLIRRYPDFDPRNYGYSHFDVFVKNEVENIQIINKNGENYLSLADNLSDVETYIYRYLSERNNKIEDMNELFEALEKEFAYFKTSNYGYNSEYGFILSFPKLEIYGNKGVKLKQTFKLK